MKIEILIERLVDQDPTLTSLNLTGVEILDPSFNHLIETLQNNTQVHTLNISGSEWCSVSLRIVARALRKRGDLQTLRLTDHCLDKIDFYPLRSLCKTLEKMKNLQTLDLRNNRPSFLLNIECRTIFYATLGQMENLQTLNLENNQLSYLDAEAFTGLCTALGQLKNLQTLNLWHNRIFSVRVKWYTLLCTALGQLKDLRALNLGRNDLIYLMNTIRPEECLTPLCAALEKMENLQTLNLACNDLSSFEEIATPLCTTLKKMENLQALDLRCNGLDCLKFGHLNLWKDTFKGHISLSEVHIKHSGLLYDGTLRDPQIEENILQDILNESNLALLSSTRHA